MKRLEKILIENLKEYKYNKSELRNLVEFGFPENNIEKIFIIMLRTTRNFYFSEPKDIFEAGLGKSLAKLFEHKDLNLYILYELDRILMFVTYYDLNNGNSIAIQLETTRDKG